MASIRELRGRIKSVSSTGKITKAYELIATSRMAKAQARVAESKPFADEITAVLAALATASSSLDSPLLVPRETPKRAGVLVITSDKGMCGGYNAAVLKRAAELRALLTSQGKEPVLYVTGRKGVNFYKFRQHEIAEQWTDFSQSPRYTDAAIAGRTLCAAFAAGADDHYGNEDGVLGVDEIHIVYTEFVSMLTQRAVAKRIGPMDVEYSDGPAGPVTTYEFEPDAKTLLDALLPKYFNTRIYAAMLESAASESAARR
jgi:F-type H+-transporting ATPase subunit gamma